MFKVIVTEEFEILLIANKVIDRRNHYCIEIYFNYRMYIIIHKIATLKINFNIDKSRYLRRNIWLAL